ncbi:hypothetical protein [Mucilaginibacter terrenus]|nr:hypothetical protein [Mucilaginibacter terrenus]
MEYAGQAVVCKVVMQPTSYDVIFDDRFMGSIAHTDEWTWIQKDGVILTDDIIEEIGFRIESQYK